MRNLRAFRIIQNEYEINEPGFYLKPDNWDDWFEYEISYYLWIKDIEKKCVGGVKIAEKNQSNRTANLPVQFETLGENFVSIGFNEYYYE